MTAIDRRTTLSLIAGAALFSALPAAAFTEADAEKLIKAAVSDINRVINSGKSERAMFSDFERIFRKYGDVPIIARATLGADARRATSSQLNAFAKEFGAYMARKYGKQFRDFKGGEVEVVGTRKIRQYYEVETVTRLPGQAPYDVRFRVSDRSGRDLFFDIVIEGVSLGKTERTEIGALLDRNRGSIDDMIQDLRKKG